MSVKLTSLKQNPVKITSCMFKASNNRNRTEKVPLRGSVKAKLFFLPFQINSVECETLRWVSFLNLKRNYEWEATGDPE